MQDDVTTPDATALAQQSEADASATAIGQAEADADRETSEQEGEDSREQNQDQDQDEGDQNEPQRPRRKSGAERWRDRARRAEAELSELRGRQVVTDPSNTPAHVAQAFEAEIVSEIGPEPRERDFEDWPAYQRAVNAWDTRRILAEERVTARFAAREKSPAKSQRRYKTSSTTMPAHWPKTWPTTRTWSAHPISGSTGWSNPSSSKARRARSSSITSPRTPNVSKPSIACRPWRLPGRSGAWRRGSLCPTQTEQPEPRRRKRPSGAAPRTRRTPGTCPWRNSCAGAKPAVADFIFERIADNARNQLAAHPEPHRQGGAASPRQQPRHGRASCIAITRPSS